MHTSRIPEVLKFRIIEVELKKPGGPVTWPNADPLKVAPSNHTVEVDKPQVRATG